jgi:hypothetical protein
MSNVYWIETIMACHDTFYSNDFYKPAYKVNLYHTYSMITLTDESTIKVDLEIVDT